MTWNPDAPGEMLDRAARVFWELSGPAAYLNWLEKEVSRTKVHLDYKKAVIFRASTAGGASQPQQPVPPTAATSVASPIVEEMVEVLRWYAADKTSDQALLMDGGASARLVLEKYFKGENS